MNNTLYQESSGLYFFSLILSVLLTLLKYGAFPVIFAKTRKTTIKAKKYNSLCYGINAIVMVAFFLFTSFNSVTYNAAPYFIWTMVFSKIGTKILTQRGILEGSQVVIKSEIKYTCTACGYEDTIPYKTCPNCGAYMHLDNKESNKIN